MKIPKQINKWLFRTGLFTLLAITGCAKKVFVQKNNAIDFDKTTSYAWVAALKDSNSSKTTAQKLVNSKVRKSFDKNLAMQGWHKVRSHPGVLLVYEVGGPTEAVSDNDPLFSQPTTRWYYNESSKGYVPIFYPARGMGFYTQNNAGSSGTLVLTILSAGTKKIIWQGRTATELNGKSLSDEEIESRVKAIIKELSK